MNGLQPPQKSRYLSPSLPVATVRFLVTLLAVCAGTHAGAQTPPPPADSAATAGPSIPFGMSRTYGDIQREFGRLRVRPRATPDSAFTESRLGIIQLVVDETISRAGAQFYDVFYQLWRPPPGAAFSTVVLSEQPLPGQGTLVSVRLDGEVVFQSRLQPREEAIEQAAQAAAQATLRRLTGA